MSYDDNFYHPSTLRATNWSEKRKWKEKPSESKIWPLIWWKKCWSEVYIIFMRYWQNAITMFNYKIENKRIFEKCASDKEKFPIITIFHDSLIAFDKKKQINFLIFALTALLLLNLVISVFFFQFVTEIKHKKNSILLLFATFFVWRELNQSNDCDLFHEDVTARETWIFKTTTDCF